jgi:hypothetical protein
VRLDQISFLQKEAHEKSQINAVVTADILDLLMEIKGEIFWTNTINQPLLGQAAHGSWAFISKTLRITAQKLAITLAYRVRFI